MHFYNSFFEMMPNPHKKRKVGLTKEALEEMILFKKGLMNWGSEELIQKFLEYEKNIAENEGKVNVLLTYGDSFLKDLRKELGFKDKGKANIMSIILNPDARKELSS